MIDLRGQLRFPGFIQIGLSVDAFSWAIRKSLPWLVPTHFAGSIFGRHPNWIVSHQSPQCPFCRHVKLGKRGQLQTSSCHWIKSKQAKHLATKETQSTWKTLQEASPVPPGLTSRGLSPFGNPSLFWETILNKVQVDSCGVDSTCWRTAENEGMTPISLCPLWFPLKGVHSQHPEGHSLPIAPARFRLVKGSQTTTATQVFWGLQL